MAVVTALSAILAVVTALSANWAVFTPSPLTRNWPVPSASMVLSSTLIDRPAPSTLMAGRVKPDAPALRSTFTPEPSANRPGFAAVNFNCTASERICTPGPTFTLRVLPTFDRPSPAVMLPAPENWLNTRASVPTTAEPLSFVQTKPASALMVPCSMKVNAPAALLPTGMSAERDHAPAATT